MANATAPHVVPGRPIVVLAGWLGCRERSLRKYVAMYERLGFSVLIRIASPGAVVSSAEKISSNNYRKSESRYEDGDAMDMTDLAWDTIRSLVATKCSAWFFHSFSNAGCFLWEKVRDTIRKMDASANTENRDNARLILDTIVGVVFDSGPAQYDRSGTAVAMQYCSWKERSMYFVSHFLNGVDSAAAKEREKQFWLGMRNDPSDTPQLYLYSKSDNLTPFAPLKDLIASRQAQFGRTLVLSRCWEKSSHCCHLLEHPDEYRSMIETFVDACLHSKSMVPRL